MNSKMKRSTAAWIWDFAGSYRPKYRRFVESREKAVGWKV